MAQVLTAGVVEDGSCADSSGQPAPGLSPRRLARADLWVDLAGLVLLASALRAYRLTSQPWTDEVSALVNSMRRPFLQIATKPAGIAAHPLYELVGHLSIRLFGESAWALRLPSAFFGVAAVPVLYLLVRRISGRLEGLLAAGLAAVSYYCIWFSQDGRGYMTMVFFGLVATLLLLDLPRPLSRRAQVGYIASASLAAYTVPFGAAIVAGHFVVAVPVVWWRRQHRADQPTAPLGSLVLVFVAAAGLAAILYLPLVGHTLHLAGTLGQETGASRFSLNGLHELVSGLRTGLAGNLGLAGALAIGVIGVADYLRRHPLVLGLLVAPVVFTVSVLIVMGDGLHPRFLMIAVIPAIALATRGLVVIGQAAAKVATPARVRLPVFLAPALVALIVLISAKPLPHYYRVPKQDYLGALRFADRTAGPGDVTVAAAIAGDVIHVYYRPSMPNIQTLSDLDRIEQSARRVLVITSLEGQVRPGDQPVLDRLHHQYRLVRVLEGTVGDGDMRIYQNGA